MGKRTGHDDVFIVTHQILEDARGCGFDVGITPVDPGVVGAEGGAEEPVSCLGHSLSSGCLRSKTVSVLDILLDLLAKVLLNERDLAVGHILIGVVLQLLEHLLEAGHGVVLGVGD